MKKLIILSLILVFGASLAFSQNTRKAVKGNSLPSLSQYAYGQVATGDLYQSHSNLRLTGDSCSNPLMITSLPAVETGMDIQNYSNMYGSSLWTPWGYGGADVVYSYTPTTNQMLNISVTGSFDQSLAIFTDCNNPDSTSQICAGTDDNSAAPFTEATVLTAVSGTTYFIVVACYYDTLVAGTWTLNVSEVAPCTDNLVVDGTPEVEPNGGMNAMPTEYDPRTPGTAAAPAKITGSLETVNCMRDMDWFDITITSPKVINVNVDIACGDVALFFGNSDMSDYDGINDNGAGLSESYESGILAPGQYWLVVSPPAYADMASFNYNVQLWATDTVIPATGESFEGTFPPTGWTILDADGDTYNWEQTDLPSQEGTKCASSASYINDPGMALTPDNWLISPQKKVLAGDVVSWWVAAQDPAYAADKYSVKLSTTGAAPADFTIDLHTEVLSSATFEFHTVDLTPYLGQNVYIAWRHWDCTDNFIMKLDNVMLPTGTPMGSVEVVANTISIYPNPSTGLVNINNVAGAKVMVYNVIGKEISSIGKANQLNTIDLSSFGVGTYFVKVVSPTETSTHVIAITK